MKALHTANKTPCFIVHGEDSENNLYDSCVFYDFKNSKEQMCKMAEREQAFQKQEWNEDFEIISGEYEITVRGIERKDTWFRFSIEETTIE